MLFSVCLSTMLDGSRRDKDYRFFLATLPVPLLPTYVVISDSRQGGIWPE